MARHLSSLISQRVLRDAETGQLSLVGLMEELSVSPPPDVGTLIAVLGVVASLWTREVATTPELVRMRATLVDPSGDRVIPSSIVEVDLRERRQGWTLLTFRTLPYRGPGTYRFSMEQQRIEDGPWEESGMTILDVCMPPAGSPP